MYAAAGGASLASRQARRKQKQHHTNENIHQAFHKRFQQLQHQHAPACAEGYHYMRTSSSGLLSPSHLPSCAELHDGHGIDFSLHEQLLEGKTPAVWLDRERKSGISPFSEIAPPLIAHKVKLSDTHKKWGRKSKIQESSFGGSSSEDLRGGLHRQYDAAANMLLYVGLCAVALGLIIAFVGTGEKGFKTVQLRMIGPTMIGCGTFCCFLRILFCFCPTRYMRRKFQKHRHKPIMDGTQLNRLPLTDRERLEYYQHLPFRPQNFVFFGQQPMVKEGKKRVSIGPRVLERLPDLMEDAASDLSTLRELSPEDDLIDLQQANSFDNIPSLDSSLDYLNERVDEPDYGASSTATQFATDEQLSRLKSTIQFRDSTDHFQENSQLMISCDEFDLQDDWKCVDKQKEEEQKLIDSTYELVLSAGSLQQHK